MQYSSRDKKLYLNDSQTLLNISILKQHHIEQLRKVIRFHEWAYYQDFNPLISDFEYDQLFKKLQALESDFPTLITADSPTQRVSNDINDGFATVPHLVPMLSLNNSYNAEDLLEFDTQIHKLAKIPEDEEIEYNIEPKYDGGSIAFIYENDLLVRSATRGNGTKGEEVTLNAKTLSSIPLKADFSKYGIHKVELRGEAVIRKNIFKKVNTRRAKNDKDVFANPRNAAAGGLRLKNPNETKKRGIEVFIFQVALVENSEGSNLLSNFPNHSDQIKMLGDLGFQIPKKGRIVCKNITEVIQYVQNSEKEREEYEYEIDGMVAKVNSYEIQQKCGSTAHHPRWAIAYKFKAKQATSRLIKVEYQVGKIGSITPVAKLDPVQLAGVTVSSVSLHNEEFIRSKDLRIGDTVLVERAGDVIPYIVKAFPELRTEEQVPLDFPTFCPVNDTSQAITLVKEESESAWRCPSCVCGKQDLQRIAFHVSKDAMDIDGFGISYVSRFMDLGWVKDIADIYNLDYDAVEQLEGFGKKSAENLKSAITKAKQNPLHRLLYSLSIHHLGRKASKLIAQQIKHISDLQNWTLEDFTDIKDIGPVVAENVISFFEKESNLARIKKLESYGVNLSQTEADKPPVVISDGLLSGKTILFTGKLHKMGRKQAQKLAEDHGARNISGVSSKLNILVVGEKAGSKLKKAEALGTVEVWTEDQFIDKMS